MYIRRLQESSTTLLTINKPHAVLNELNGYAKRLARTVAMQLDRLYKNKSTAHACIVQ